MAVAINLNDFSANKLIDSQSNDTFFWQRIKVLKNTFTVIEVKAEKGSVNNTSYVSIRKDGQKRTKSFKNWREMYLFFKDNPTIKKALREVKKEFLQKN